MQNGGGPYAVSAKDKGLLSGILDRRMHSFIQRGKMHGQIGDLVLRKFFLCQPTGRIHSPGDDLIQVFVLLFHFFCQGIEYGNPIEETVICRSYMRVEFDKHILGSGGPNPRKLFESAHDPSGDVCNQQAVFGVLINTPEGNSQDPGCEPAHFFCLHESCTASGLQQRLHELFFRTIRHFLMNIPVDSCVTDPDFQKQVDVDKFRHAVSRKPDTVFSGKFQTNSLGFLKRIRLGIFQKQIEKLHIRNGSNFLHDLQYQIPAKIRFLSLQDISLPAVGKQLYAVGFQ